jgi:hypothetical protein
MNKYGIFYDGILEDKYNCSEAEAKAIFSNIVQDENKEGNQLYNTIELIEMKEIESYKYEIKDDELEVTHENKNFKK